jgi:hypothetical protein
MRTNPRIREEREHLESSSLVTYKSLGELTVLSTIGEEFRAPCSMRLLSVRSVFVEELSRMEWSIVEHEM